MGNKSEGRKEYVDRFHLYQEVFSVKSKELGCSLEREMNLTTRMRGCESSSISNQNFARKTGQSLHDRFVSV